MSVGLVIGLAMLVLAGLVLAVAMAAALEAWRRARHLDEMAEAMVRKRWSQVLEESGLSEQEGRELLRRVQAEYEHPVDIDLPPVERAE